MSGSILMFAFGGLQLIVGALVAKRALTARARLSPWRGQLIIGSSSIALGATWLWSRGEIRDAAAMWSLACIIGFTIGSVITLRETKRLTGR
jgi:hypothetical protein